MKKRIISIILSVTLIMSTFACLSAVTASAATTTAVASGATANQQNIVDRANYMYNSTWVCQKTVNGWNNKYTFYAGNTYHLPYAWPVSAGAYIGFGISVPDFLAAAADANSAFYNKRSYLSGASYSYSTYYGTDCSGFVSWCWGASRNTTATIPNIATYKGMANTNNNTWTLQLGDALNSNSVGHVVLVTGLSYGSNGAITQIEITEQTPPQLKRSYYTPSSLASKYGANYGIYRYNKSVPASPDGGNSIQKQVKNFVFDAGYYATRYTDLKNAYGYDADKLYDHFLNHGIAEGRCASPFFDVNWYMNQNDQELRDYCAGDYTKAYQHFLDYVKNEGELQYHAKKLSEIFDTGYYYNKYADLRNAGLNTEFKLLEHFYNNGTWEWRTGSAEFDPVCYALNNQDVYDEYIVNQGKYVPGIYHHYMTFGQFEVNEKPERRNKANIANLGSSFYATITDKNSGKNLELVYDVESSEYPDKNAIQINTARESRSQIWKFERQEDGTYKITNKKYGKCLDVYNNLRTKTKLGAWDDNGASAQRWTLYMKDGYCVMKGGCTGFVADVSGKNTADYSDVYCDSFNGGDNQLFLINVIPQDYGEKFQASIKTVCNDTMALSLNDNESVVVKTDTDADDQIWTFEQQSDGSYKITNKKNGKCLDLSGANTANETDILTYEDNGSDAQRWYLYRDSDDSFIIRPVCGLSANIAMDLYGIRKGDTIPEGSNISIHQYNGSAAQQFRIEFISEDLGTDFEAPISTACDRNKVLTANADGNLVINTKAETDDQLWHFERQSDSTYIITNKATGKCIDLEDWSTADMSNIALHTSHGGTNQRWAFIKNSDGSYTIRPVCGFTQNAVMELYGANTADGSNISIYTYNASEAQKLFVELPEEDVLMGDINGDGSVSLIDALYVQKAALQIIDLDKTAQKAADINGDGVINIMDAITIHKMSLNL